MFSNNNIVDILIKSSESAALSCTKFVGNGDGKKCDHLAVEAMRSELSKADFKMKIVIGEGERDEAPMLYIGEELGSLESKVIYDIAVDPLEGTNLCANGLPNSITSIVASKQGSLLFAPDVYMAKIATGINLPNGDIDLDMDIVEIIKNIAKFLKISIEDVKVLILERDRHLDIIDKIRKCGAKAILFSDGDILATIKAMNYQQTGCHLYIGTGGAPEGVISSVSVNTVGGFMQGRLISNDEKQIARAKTMGIADFNKKYSSKELSSEGAIFVATGVTDGDILDAPKFYQDKVITNSIIFNSQNKTVLKIYNTRYCV